MINRYWIGAAMASLLTLGAVAQTSASGSASGGASITPGQAGVNANASQSTQTPVASGNVDASANATASRESQKQNSEKKRDKDSNSRTGGGNSTPVANGPGAAQGISGAIASGTTLQAELTKPVDAKKAKAGDPVTAKLTQDVKSDGKVVLPRGSKLVGHVTEAQAKSKDNAESKLGIIFDKAETKGGQELAFNGAIQALAPPVQGALAVAGDEQGSLGSGMGTGGGAMGGGRSGGGAVAPLGGAMGGVTSTLGSAGRTVGNTTGSVAGSATGAVGASANGAVNGTLNSTSQGVVGMQGLALSNALGAGANAQSSVISSASHNVKLDSGTQLVLQVTGAAAAH